MKKNIILCVLTMSLSHALGNVSNFHITNSTEETQKILVRANHGFIAPPVSNERYTALSGFKITLPNNKQSSHAKIKNPNNFYWFAFLQSHQAITSLSKATTTLQTSSLLTVTGVHYVAALNDGRYADFHQKNDKEINIKLGVTLDDIKQRLISSFSGDVISLSNDITLKDIPIFDRHNNLLSIYKRSGSVLYTDSDNLQVTIPAPMTIRFHDTKFVITDAPNVRFIKEGVSYEGLAALEAPYQNKNNPRDIANITAASSTLYMNARYNNDTIAPISFSLNKAIACRINLQNAKTADINLSNTKSVQIKANSIENFKLNGANLNNKETADLSSVTEYFSLDIPSYFNPLYLNLPNASAVHINIVSQINGIDTNALLGAFTEKKDSNSLTSSIRTFENTKAEETLPETLPLNKLVSLTVKKGATLTINGHDITNPA